MKINNVESYDNNYNDNQREKMTTEILNLFRNKMKLENYEGIKSYEQRGLDIF